MATTLIDANKGYVPITIYNQVKGILVYYRAHHTLFAPETRVVLIIQMKPFIKNMINMPNPIDNGFNLPTNSCYHLYFKMGQNVKCLLVRRKITDIISTI